MATITGKAGAVTIAAAAVNGKVLSWSLDVTSKNVETPGAGDSWMERIPLLSDYELQIEFEAADQADWNLNQGVVNTEVAVALKRKSGDTNPYFTATCLITGVKVDAPADNAVKVTITAKSSTSSAPTFDTTPAT
jgi:hypothetical protein